MNLARLRTAAARASSQAKRTAARRKKINDMAELLAEGRSMSEIPNLLGISRSSAEIYLAIIRKELGPQAV